MPQLPITNEIRADDLASAFNSSTERRLWRATKGGTRLLPTVRFISSGSMVQITYHLKYQHFTVVFSRASCAFGDFLASTFRDLSAILAALKASGYPFAAAVDPAAVLRVEYDPRSKVATVAVALTGDDWQDAEPMPLNVPERTENNTNLVVDVPKYDL